LVKELDVKFPSYRVQELYEFTSGFEPPLILRTRKLKVKREKP